MSERYLILCAALACAALPACDDEPAATADATADAALDAAPDQDPAPDEGAPQPPPFEAADLAGTWTSAACEAVVDGDGAAIGLDRQLTFTDTDWHLFATVFADADCRAPRLSFEVEGPYALTGQSPLGADVAEATFGFARNTWTAWTEDAAAALTDAGCGDGPWQPGVARDVLATGCLDFAHAAADCPDGERDVVRLDGDRLALGARTVDLCAERAPAVGAAALHRQVDAVLIDVPLFHPEGIAIGPDRSLYTGAFTTGEIRRAPFGSATADVIAPAGALGGAALGMKVHDGTLWVCATDLAEPANSALVHLDPLTGAERARFPLPGGGICNDIAFDAMGNAFITESSQNDVHRLLAGAEALEPWFDGAALPPPGGLGFGFNGLVVDADGSVLVGRVDDGTLTRIPVLPDGGAGEARIIPVEPAATALGIDGMQRWRGALYAVRDNAIVRLEPGADAYTAEPLHTGLDVPATLTIDASGNVWVSESRFGLLFDGDDSTNAEPPFRLVRVPLY